MVPSGPPTPISGGQPMPPSLMRSSSGVLGGQGGSMPSQNVFSSLTSSHGQFNNMNMLGNVLNASSQLNQSFGNGGHSQLAGIVTGAESHVLSNVGQVQGQQFSSALSTHARPDQPQSQQFEQQNCQNGQPMMQQFSAPQNTQQQQSQQQFQSVRGGMAGVRPVKVEPQMTRDSLGEQRVLPHQTSQPQAHQPQQQNQQQQLQSLRNPGPVKLEPQQIQSMRGLPPVKSEPHHSESSLFLQQQSQQQQSQQQQQQQHQQLLQMTRQSPQAAAAQINMMHRQRILQLQQQQLMKVMPGQHAQLPPQFQQQNLPLRSPMKPAYEPGMCARRLTHYMYQQQHRPEDNNIEFWRKFVAEYFAPNAKKKWCVSMYGNGRQPTGVFPQDIWHCEICNRKPGRGFEATVEVLPRLFKIKYESGTLEELLYVDMPREYQNSSGQIVLDYAKAIQESVFEHLRVVRDGQLRVVFSQDLKICSWEFCARHHEELIPRRLLIPQVTQLGAAAQKYQTATQNASSNLSVPELQNNCNMFLSSARQLAKALEVPLVNELGYTKRYVRCLQISEVVNSMKDLIDFSRETGSGPMESLAKYPRRTSGSSGFQETPQQPETQQHLQQSMSQSMSTDPATSQATAMQVDSSNSVAGGNNSLNVPLTSTSSMAHGHQNSMNFRHQNLMNGGSPYATANGVQIASPGSSTTTIPPGQPNLSPFQSPTPSLSNNPSRNSADILNSVASPASASLQHQGISSEADQSESQSSVQKILQEMMSSPLNGSGAMGALGNESKHVNGVIPGSNMGGLNTSIHNPGMGYGHMGAQPSMVNGFRNSVVNRSLSMNGRVEMGSMVQGQSMNRQSEMNNQILNGLRAANGLNNLPYNWKPSP